MMVDSNNIIRGVIQSVKAYPMLYDVNHPQYKNTRERERLWGRIGRELGISGLVAKTKWRNIRDCYMKYLRTYQTMLTAAGNTGVKYKSWLWADEMEFMRPHRFFRRKAGEAVRNGRGASAGGGGAGDHTEEQDAAGAGEEQTEGRGEQRKAVADDDLWQEMRRRRRQHAASLCRPHAPVHPPRPLRDPRPAPPLDATEHIFLGYAKLVKNFSPRRRAVLKLKIANLMMEAELEELHDQTDEGDVMIEMDVVDGSDPLEKGVVAKLEPEDTDEEEQLDENVE